MADRKQDTPKSPSPVRAGAFPSTPASGGSALAEVTLWEACDPALFTRHIGLWVLANEGNIHFRLHIVGDRHALFQALAACKVKCLIIEDA